MWFVPFACIMAWLGKDGDFQGQAKRRAALTPVAEGAGQPLPFEERMQQLGICVLASPGGLCVHDSLERTGEESTGTPIVTPTTSTMTSIRLHGPVQQP